MQLSLYDQIFNDLSFQGPQEEEEYLFYVFQNLILSPGVVILWVKLLMDQLTSFPQLFNLSSRVGEVNKSRTNDKICGAVTIFALQDNQYQM